MAAAHLQCNLKIRFISLILIILVGQMKVILQLVPPQPNPLQFRSIISFPFIIKGHLAFAGLGKPYGKIFPATINQKIFLYLYMKSS